MCPIRLRRRGRGCCVILRARLNRNSAMSASSVRPPTSILPCRVSSRRTSRMCGGVTTQAEGGRVEPRKPGGGAKPVPARGSPKRIGLPNPTIALPIAPPSARRCRIGNVDFAGFRTLAAHTEGLACRCAATFARSAGGEGGPPPPPPLPPRAALFAPEGRLGALRLGTQGFPDRNLKERLAGAIF